MHCSVLCAVLVNSQLFNYLRHNFKHLFCDFSLKLNSAVYLIRVAAVAELVEHVNHQLNQNKGLTGSRPRAMVRIRVRAQGRC